MKSCETKNRTLTSANQPLSGVQATVSACGVGGPADIRCDASYQRCRRYWEVTAAYLCSL